MGGVSDTPNAPCDGGYHRGHLTPPVMTPCYFFLRTKIIFPIKCTPPPHPLPINPLPTTPPPHPPTHQPVTICDRVQIQNNSQVLSIELIGI